MCALRVATFAAVLDLSYFPKPSVHAGACVLRLPSPTMESTTKAIMEQSPCGLDLLPIVLSYHRRCDLPRMRHCSRKSTSSGQAFGPIAADLVSTSVHVNFVKKNLNSQDRGIGGSDN